MDVYLPLVYGFLRRRGLQDSDAADVSQEVMSRVSRSIPGFAYDRDRGRFRDWLWTITRNEIRRYWEVRGRRPEGVSATSGDSAIGQLMSDGESAEWNEEFHRHVLRTALDHIQSSFECRTWQAFSMVWIDQLPAMDVAARMSEPVDFVYVAKSRVLKRLKEEVVRLAEDLAIAVR